MPVMNMITCIRPDAATPSHNPTREEAEAAFRTIICWAGDNPDRDGLAKTPARLARAFEEYFSGYSIGPAQMLSTTFEETNGYDEMIVLRSIDKPHARLLPRQRGHAAGISFARQLGIRCADIARLKSAQSSRIEKARDAKARAFLREFC